MTAGPWRHGLDTLGWSNFQHGHLQNAPARAARYDTVPTEDLHVPGSAAGLRWHFLGENGQKPVAKHLNCVCCEAEEEELEQQSVY